MDGCVCGGGTGVGGEGGRDMTGERERERGRGEGGEGVRACWVFLKVGGGVVSVGWGFGDLREEDVLDARRGWFSLGDGTASLHVSVFFGFFLKAVLLLCMYRIGLHFLNVEFDFSIPPTPSSLQPTPAPTPAPPA